MSKLTQRLSSRSDGPTSGTALGGSGGSNVADPPRGQGSGAVPIGSAANNASKESFSLSGRTPGGKLRKHERARKRAEGREERDCALM